MPRAVVILAAVASVLPVCLMAKGDTIRVVIIGGDLANPIEIRDSKIAVRFTVWAGPGTSSNEAQGLNVDWSRGAVNVPKGLPVYQVSFVTTRTNPGTYIVRYAFDPATGAGYVCIPGKGEPEYRDNVFLIYRGIEGNWFHASSEWEKLANPLIVKARPMR